MNDKSLLTNVNSMLVRFAENIKSQNPIEKILNVIVILLFMKIFLAIGNAVIDKLLNPNKLKKITDKDILKINFSIDERRYDTLNAITKSIYKYTVIFVGIITILASFNVRIESILAVAGIGGIAIGFGAQSLVEDIVTGAFIFLENQFSVGEYITIDKFEGIVEELGLRTTRIRDFNGDLHIIHNGKISEVTNHSRGNMRALVDVPISYDEDIQKCINVLTKICEEVGKDSTVIVEGPSVLGVEQLDKHSINIRIVAKTQTMEQWGVERILRQKIKEEFDRQDIKIAFSKIIF